MTDVDCAPDDDSMPSSQQICRACGLCCRGVWFSHVTVEQDEVDRAQSAGLELETVDGSPAFPQPCPLHGKDGCSAYATWRPRTCVTYTCALLDRFQTGEASFDETLRHVKAARGMADRVQTEAGPAARGLMGKAFMSRLAPPISGVSGEQPLSPGAKLDAVTLRVYFMKYFQKKTEAAG